jgi:signal transduction histidine kinase
LQWQNAEVIGSSLDKISERIQTLVKRNQTYSSELEDLANEIKEDQHAIESILLCASHQGRIADDILNGQSSDFFDDRTLILSSVSKLNMGLLSCNPVPFELVPRAAEVVRMFETFVHFFTYTRFPSPIALLRECQQQGIALSLNDSPTIAAFECNWVIADPSRISQILINL